MLWLAKKCVWLNSFVVFAYLCRCKQWGKCICGRCHPSPVRNHVHIRNTHRHWLLSLSIDWTPRIIYACEFILNLLFYCVEKRARERERISKSPYVFRFKYIDHIKTNIDTRLSDDSSIISRFWGISGSDRLVVAVKQWTLNSWSEGVKSPFDSIEIILLLNPVEVEPIWQQSYCTAHCRKKLMWSSSWGLVVKNYRCLLQMLSVLKLMLSIYY